MDIYTLGCIQHLSDSLERCL